MNKKVHAVLQCSKTMIPDITGICLDDSNDNNCCYIVSDNEYYNNKIVTSIDGIHWDTIVLSNLDNNITYHWNAICWSPVLETNSLCAVGNNGYYIKSTNGINWTLGILGSGNINYEMIYWSTIENKFYAISTEHHKKAISADGDNWELSDLTIDELKTIEISHYASSWNINTAVFDIAKDFINTDGYGNSTDNADWFNDDNNGPFAIVNSELDNDYILINYDNSTQRFSIIYPKNDNLGINVILNKFAPKIDYDTVFTKLDIKLLCADYSAPLNYACGITTVNNICYTIAGYNWTEFSVVDVLNQPITAIKWVNSLGSFYTITADGQNASSITGLSWTTGIDIPVLSDCGLIPMWSQLCWSESEELMVAVSNTNYPAIAVSTDGRNWELRNIIDNNEYAIADIERIEELNQFIMIDSLSNTVLFSSDAVTWGTVTIDEPTSEGLKNITWDKTHGTVFILSKNRSIIFKSNDLSTWEIIKLPVSNTWAGIEWIDSKSYLAVFGYDKLLYSADLINWKIVEHSYDVLYPLDITEITTISKCLLINRINGTVYLMNLRPGSDIGIILNEKQKWLISNYRVNNDINLINNPNFNNNTFNNWNIIGNETNDNNGIRKYHVYENNIHINFAKIINRMTEGADGLGIESDWIDINENTMYNCHLLARGNNNNCYAYLYGKKVDSTIEMIRISDTCLNSSVYADVNMHFSSLDFIKIKLCIKFVNPSYDDFFMFSNVELIPYSNVLKDLTQFNNNATIYDYDIEFNGILSDNCLKLKGNDFSYIEFAQPFKTNDTVTISLWVKFNNLKFLGEKGIIYSGTESSNLKIYVKKYNNKNTVCVELNQNEIDSNYEIQENQWYHLAYTYDLSVSTLYINGKIINNTSIVVDDNDNMIYRDSSYFARIGNIAKSNSDNYTESVWDGSTETTNWYLNNNSNNYIISSASDLAGLSKLVNSGAENFSNCTLTLKTNINLNNFTWNPIGYYNANENIYRPFKGIFNGNNFSITNVHFNIADDDTLFNPYSFNTNVALFGYIDGTNTGIIAAITSLKVTGTIVSEMIPSNHTIEAFADDFNTAGVVAKGKNCKISSCSYSGYLTSIATSGGIIGDGTNTELYDCVNNSVIVSSKSTIGGIIGYMNSGKLVNCKNTGNITLVSNKENNAAGGIVGYFYGGNLESNKYYEISNCSNTGRIIGRSEDYSFIQISTAGIVGQIDNLDAETRVQGCHNSGIIMGIGNCGGIIGTVLSNENNLKVYEAINTGMISGAVDLTGNITDIISKRNIGGIIGSIEYYSTDWLHIHGCINNGLITKGEIAGGILGINKNKTNIYNCVNNGTLENNYVSSGITGKIDGFTKINNCLNIGKINKYEVEFPTYIGCIIGVTQNIGYISEDEDDNILSKYNVYLNSSLVNQLNLFDTNVNAISKSKAEITDVSILNDYLNMGINLTETYKYINSYDDGIINYYQILEYLNLVDNYPLPEEAIGIIINALNASTLHISEYVPLSISVCDIKFFDYTISHRNIREYSRAKLLQYKCVNKSETNKNFIPVENGTYSSLIAKNDGDDSPLIELVEDCVNIFGKKVWKLTFLPGSITSDLGYHSRVETEDFILPSSEANSNFTFSIYLKGEEININKLSFKIIVNNNDIPLNIINTNETIGSESLDGVYTRYSITTNTIAEPDATAYQLIGLKAGTLGTLDPNILDDEFTVYLMAPQLENKDAASIYAEAPIIGKLYDSSSYLKHINFDLDGCPTYNEIERAYVFTPFKKITIPNEYVPQSNNFTVSFWFKAITADGYIPARFIIGRSSDFFANGAGWHISVDKIYGDIIFETMNPNETKAARFYTGSNFINWKYLTAVYNNGKMYTYVDGVNITANTTGFTMLPYISDIIIGSNFVTNDLSNIDLSIGHMHGDMMRDIRIFNTALSAEDVLDLYQASGTVDSTGILHAYNFISNKINNNMEPFTISKKNMKADDWYNNTNIHNSIVEYWPLSGISKNYTHNNNPFYINAVTSGKGIKNNKCVKFNGNNSFAYSRTKLEIDSLNGLTISFWIKINREFLTSSCIMEYSEDASVNNAFSIYYNENGNIQYSDHYNSSVTTLESNTALNDNLWHFITIIILRGKNISIYIDCNKDAITTNYGIENESIEDISYSTAKISWINEYDYNYPINQISAINNKIYYNKLNYNNTLFRYTLNGDNSIVDILSSISNLPNSLMTKYTIDQFNNKIYFVMHNYGIGNSYIMSYDIASGIKKTITDCYYSADIIVNNDRLFITDRECLKYNNLEYAQYELNYINNLNSISVENGYDSFHIKNITSIYTGSMVQGVFVKTKTFDSSLYELHNNRIVWISNISGNFPTGKYYVDFKYTGVNYGQYNVKCIELNNINNVINYYTKHNNIITGIILDRDNNIYTSSYDSTVKKTSPNGLIWTYDLFNSWVYTIKISADHEYIFATSRDKTLRKIDKNGKEIWRYTNEEGCEINEFAVSNKYIYCAFNRNNKVIRNLISSDAIWTSTNHGIIKMDMRGNILWKKEVSAPISEIYLIPSSNKILTVNMSGVTECIHEIFSKPYDNHKLYLGAHNNAEHFFKGFMQDLKIYNRELTFTEMDNQYNSFCPMINKMSYITSDNAVFTYQDIDEIN